MEHGQPVVRATPLPLCSHVASLLSIPIVEYAEIHGRHSRTDLIDDVGVDVRQSVADREDCRVSVLASLRHLATRPLEVGVTADAVLLLLRAAFRDKRRDAASREVLTNLVDQHGFFSPEEFALLHFLPSPIPGRLVEVESPVEEEDV
jgi:hypothetical protein